MSSFHTFISGFQALLLPSLQRAGLVLRGQPEWIHLRLDEVISVFHPQRCIQLGGEPRQGVEFIDSTRGRLLLGQECHLLIVDLASELDADNLNAVLGTLVGGGLLVFAHTMDGEQHDMARQWLLRAMGELVTVSQHAPLPPLPEVTAQKINCCDMSEQKDVIGQIIRVYEGHRKRPLVVTADRGRGKSSALGIAAAQLMQCRPSIRIVVTAPSHQSVQALFSHAQCVLRIHPDKLSHKRLSWQSAELVFMPADELLRSESKVDILLIDEASAIPVSVLQKLTLRYSRVVFSTTIHGYEGCGRGFTLKFLAWLKSSRPQFNWVHMSQPVRWAADDPLERWQFQTFLLDSDLPDIRHCPKSERVHYRYVEKEELYSSPAFFSSIFALLTHAHYQTSPNDMMRILSDPHISVFIAEIEGVCIGCLLLVNEGKLSVDVIQKIQAGQHRPRGQLVPVSFINQLGFVDVGRELCSRIMRIVVHPGLQRCGIGGKLLNHYVSICPSDYVATSFGASEALLHFWTKQQFYPVKIGSRRDQSSGCYSVLMVYQCQQSWFKQARLQFSYYLLHSLKADLNQLEPSIIRHMLLTSEPVCLESIPFHLLSNYAKGGANYESVAVWIHALVGRHPHISALVIDELMVMKVLQERSWSEVASAFSLSGRKMVETEIRKQTGALLSALHCK